MALKNYTTNKTVGETAGDIMRILAEHGARRVMFEYSEGGDMKAVCFSIVTNYGEQGIRLPANVDRVQAVLKKQANDPKNRSRARIDASAEQSARVAWRVVKDWLDSQLALLETEMVEMDQLFLPYFVNKNGQTLYEIYATGQLMIGENGR